MNELLTLQNAFIAVSIFSTVLYILKLILFMCTGADAEVDADFDSITETDTSFTFLSVQSLLAFFMGFGWSGLSALVQFNATKPIALLVAIVVGLFFMYASAYLMFCIKKLNKTIKKDLNELINKQGRTYTSFPPNGEGKIEIDYNNKLSILEAINLSDEEINSFVQIKVEKIENNKIYIVKI